MPLTQAQQSELEAAKAIIESFNPFEGTDNSPADPEQAGWEDIDSKEE